MTQGLRARDPSSRLLAGLFSAWTWKNIARFHQIALWEDPRPRPGTRISKFGLPFIISWQSLSMEMIKGSPNILILGPGRSLGSSHMQFGGIWQYFSTSRLKIGRPKDGWTGIWLPSNIHSFSTYLCVSKVYYIQCMDIMCVLLITNLR